MASLTKKPGSGNWIACYTDAAGVQRQKSTGTTDRKQALEIADGYETVARQSKTEVQVRKVIADITEETLGKPVAQLTCDQWFNQDWPNGGGADHAGVARGSAKAAQREKTE